MAEAKKRNPSIKIYGLPWAFPQWVSCNPGTLANCTDDPYSRPNATAAFIGKWVTGAKTLYDVDVDYVGVWNERQWDANYIKAIRQELNRKSPDTKIVAADGSWDIAEAMLKDAELMGAVDAIGAHYPGTTSTVQAEATQKPLWSSEDDSTFNITRLALAVGLEF